MKGLKVLNGRWWGRSNRERISVKEGRWSDRGQGNRNDHLCNALTKLAWNEGLPPFLSPSSPPTSSLLSPQTTCWHCPVYSWNKMLIKRGWNYCMYGQGTPFISLPSSYPSSPFTLHLADFSFTRSRLYNRPPADERTPPENEFFLSFFLFSRANLEQLTDIDKEDS